MRLRAETLVFVAGRVVLEMLLISHRTDRSTAFFLIPVPLPLRLTTYLPIPRIPRMRLPSASIHSFANNCPLYFVKYRCGMVVYNDDAFVYAARLEVDTGDANAVALEDASSSEDDIDSDEEEEEEEEKGDGKEEKEEGGAEEEEDNTMRRGTFSPSALEQNVEGLFDATDQTEADRIEERRRHAEDGEGGPEELEEKVSSQYDGYKGQLDEVVADEAEL